MPDGIVSFSKGCSEESILDFVTMNNIEATTDKTSDPNGNILLKVPALDKDGQPMVFVIPEHLYCWTNIPENSERGWRTF